MNERVEYTLLDPSGNTTLLVETPVPESRQPSAAKQLMETEKETEQVGFVSLDDNGVRLRMAGGEFCGNASMCAAALALWRTGRTDGAVSVRVSGTADPVQAVMTGLGGGTWRGSVTMPAPLSVGPEVFPDGRIFPVVRFPGIAHVILEEDMDPKEAEALAPVWCRHLQAEALGLMFLDCAAGTLRPLVWVPAAGTLFWESSCASGTTAAGAFLASRSQRPVRQALVQPGGTLEISAEPGGHLLLSGSVRILHSASAQIGI